MNVEELRLEAEAFTFIKKNKDFLISTYASPATHVAVGRPISLFMAGSPGAGKTEVSKSLTRKFESMPVRIDADEIRSECPGYQGNIAHVFQKAANKGVNILYDHVLHHRLNCILDGTFAYAGAIENIRRSIEHGRIVEVWFVYQDPRKAWEFTKVREATESRHVSKDVFIRAFCESRLNAKAVKSEFGPTIDLNLLVKDYENGREEFKLNINAEDLDRHIGRSYTEGELNKMLI